MFERPDVDGIIEAGASFGFALGREEVATYRKHLIERLAAFDSFLSEERVDEGAPPVTYAARAPGYRPGPDEDPYNAWMWKCHIEGATEGLLAGKTVSFKDHTAVAGIPCTFGSYQLEGFVPDFDATTVTRVLAAGGTIIGKNTMDGLAGGKGYGGLAGDYGRPKNPHNPAYLTGGSSSGSGAALAAGEVDISFGGDQGGSIRSPASWCGVVGLKPTFGLVSHFGVAFGMEPSIDYTGPMARTVENTAAALQAVAGYDGLDLLRQDRTVPDSVDALSSLGDGVKGLRVAVVEEGFDEGTEPDVRDAIMAAADVFASLGAEVSKVSIPEHRTVARTVAALYSGGGLAVFDAGFMGAFARTHYPTKIVAAIGRMNHHATDALPPSAKLSLLTETFSRRNFYGAVYAKAHNVRKAYIAAYDAALATHDILLMPTSHTVAQEWVDPATKSYAEDLTTALAGSNRLRNRQPFNFTGHPGLSIPCGKSNRLPIGLQLIGKFYDDPLLLQAAYAYQESVDWQTLITPGA